MGYRRVALLVAISAATVTRLDAASPAPAVAQSLDAARLGEERQRTELALPFAGTWIVGQANHGAESHHGYAAYALDLVQVDADGRAYVRGGKRTRDWIGFGADLLATADGVVVRAVDRYPDNPVLGKATQANTVIVKHAQSEFSEYVHLQHGSLRVHVGDRVRRGQVLARCGNSGAETPHLHWAMLSSVDPIRTRPAVFSRYELRSAAGAWQPTTGTPSSRDLIRPGAN